jgi:hypothetical protein
LTTEVQQATEAHTEAQQTVNWSEPATHAALLALHRREALRGSRFTLATLALLLGIGVFQAVSAQNWLILLGAALVVALIARRIRLALARLSVAAQAGGTTHYHLSGDVLHVQNTLGTFQIPLALMERVHAHPGGLIVVYAGQSVLTIPNGPLRRALEPRLSSSLSAQALSAPGGTP